MSVPSPCIQICAMDTTSGYCQGCWRTLDEIAAWSTLSDPDKLRLWRVLRQRRETAAQITPKPVPDARKGAHGAPNPQD
ncbi:MAG: DUF1289 domain-containing protein [Betaproteobacteria bacterium]|nr:DUF1289 domain-containing protein [Betaproteobacteria bacterium]MDE2122714.1 DUF1289 domain-containing protein [Betaproteobacteria bacterium]MDE2186735.1 DUF1289 domain-containing protein [Betaproteobacteria bacterium]MDE2323887.1 DUF1289 domain-containing protein [Betaproteobacteria bacterium]